MPDKKSFFFECYQLEIVKFGHFTLKSGIQSPFYIDLRPLASDPKILKRLANFLLDILPLDDFDLICGVPYAALPMATAMSLESYLPLIIKRKEPKNYGTKKLIEGIYKKGQNCLLVEDVITSGKSLLETISDIENEGVKVSDIVVVLDRQQGGKELLESKGYRVHTLFTISQIIQWLFEDGKLNQNEVEKIQDFIDGNITKLNYQKRLSYSEKRNKIAHIKGKKILDLAIEKKSNLIAAIDVLTTKELLYFADILGPHIVALKTHIDIITDFDYDATIIPLIDLAAKHKFLLMEDRKFADIGSTQELQYTEGIYKISHWADLVTAQVIGGYSSLDCFQNTGVVAIIGMSSEGTLTDSNYREGAIKIAKSHPFVLGAVSQNQLPDDLLLFTPGVHIDSKGDGKGQQYNSPEFIFKKLKSDFIIVGRGIYKSKDPKSTAQLYQKIGWEEYENSLLLK